VAEAGYTGPPPPAYDVAVGSEVVPATRENLDKCMDGVLALMRQQEESAAFREPVNAEDVPDYYSVVKNPMDLQTMQARCCRLYGSRRCRPQGGSGAVPSSPWSADNRCH
jgi:histone acetyltransferase